MIIKWEKELGENNHKYLSPYTYTILTPPTHPQLPSICKIINQFLSLAPEE